eukprot:12887832-Prorocentrum_lima.AAC.1
MRYMRSLAPKDTRHFKEWQRSLGKYEWQLPDKQIIKTALPFTAKDIGELQDQGKGLPRQPHQGEEACTLLNCS